MPDTFTPDQFSQTQTVPPISGATPCAKDARKAKAPARKPPALSADLLSQIWRRADEIDCVAHPASIAFGMVWEIMEDISSHAVDAQSQGKDELLTLSDRLYLLLNGVQDRMDTMHKAGKAITQLSGRTPKLATHPGDDPIQPFWTTLKSAQAAMSACEGDPPEEMQDAYLVACDRFMETRTTSPEGILRKLEYLAEVENVEALSREEPQLIQCRVILGLIRDLRSALGRTE
jgi:hypothetical protein